MRNTFVMQKTKRGHPYICWAFVLLDAPRGQVGNVFVMEIRQNKGGSMKQGQKMGIATISDDMRTKRIAKISNRTKYIKKTVMMKISNWCDVISSLGTLAALIWAPINNTGAAF